ncbi:hypothetical protein SEA_ZOOMAN_302 [Microbacterium phage Zooman]|nr:hypothetical protein SEA_ZOOMAN_302 [Microbacterium phage Zooman]
MTLYTRHGFVITEDEGDEARPPVYRCGGIGMCEEDSIDYLMWRSRQWVTREGVVRVTDAELHKGLDNLLRAASQTEFKSAEFERGFTGAIMLLRGIVQGEPDIAKALRSFW